MQSSSERARWWPTRSRAPELLVDTRVAVALVVVDHEHHELATVTAELAGQATLRLMNWALAPAR